jgi:Growth-Arrest-Specific Protein 2 Domain
VPIKKLGNGYYIFGTRKIYAKILNGKLVIRVGGGYMIIEEFINTYAEQELAKINKIQQNERDKEEAEDDVDSLDIPPASRSKPLKILNPIERGGSGRQSLKSPNRKSINENNT